MQPIRLKSQEIVIDMPPLSIQDVPLQVQSVEEAEPLAVLPPTDVHTFSWMDMIDTVTCGDALVELQKIPTNSIDALITDPPAGISFMNKEWDTFKVDRAAKWEREGKKGQSPPYSFEHGHTSTKKERDIFISFMTNVMTEALRCVKPGGHGVIWSLPRTSHWTATALEDSGWEIREKIYHIFGTGFPKGTNVSSFLTSLPWCTCRGSQEASTTTENRNSPPTNEGISTVDTSLHVSLDGTSFNTFSAIKYPVSPFEGVSTNDRATFVSSPSDRFSTEDTRRFGDEFSGRTWHGQSTMQGSIEESKRQFDPIVFRASHMTAMATSNKVTHNISSIQVQPETLGDEMMSNQSITPPTVSTHLITNDNRLRDVTPESSLVRPPTTTPSMIATPRQENTIIDSHTSTGAVLRGRRTLRQETRKESTTDSTCEDGSTSTKFNASSTFKDDSLSSTATFLGTEFSLPMPGIEVDSAILTLFGKHESIIRQLITESKVLVCKECFHPIKPSWVVDELNTTLKPSTEEWILVRKPLQEKTIVKQVLATGTGAINIGATRIEAHDSQLAEKYASLHNLPPRGNHIFGQDNRPRTDANTIPHPLGRWPTNTLMSHSSECIYLGVVGIQEEQTISSGKGFSKDKYAGAIGIGEGTTNTGIRNYGDNNTSQLWRCAKNCPVQLLREQSGYTESVRSVRKLPGRTRFTGQTYNGGKPLINQEENIGGQDDRGFADRFFPVFQPNEEDIMPFKYQAKSSRRERSEGLETHPLIAAQSTGWSGESMPLRQDGTERKMPEKQNDHSTVKPLQLMRWLIRLVTPPDGIVLDCFAGSGSTLAAAVLENKRFIGVEQDFHYTEIAKMRINYWKEHREQK